jgi:hypothetical protein
MHACMHAMHGKFFCKCAIAKRERNIHSDLGTMLWFWKYFRRKFWQQNWCLYFLKSASSLCKYVIDHNNGFQEKRHGEDRECESRRVCFLGNKFIAMLLLTTWNPLLLRVLEKMLIHGSRPFSFFTYTNKSTNIGSCSYFLKILRDIQKKTFAVWLSANVPILKTWGRLMISMGRLGRRLFMYIHIPEQFSYSTYFCAYELVLRLPDMKYFLVKSLNKSLWILWLNFPRKIIPREKPYGKFTPCGKSLSAKNMY